MWDDIEFFSEHEFACKCGCGNAPMDLEFLKVLDKIRRDFAKPLTVSSGYRCSEHPIEARKKKPGAPSTGLACDLLVHGQEALEVLRLALSHPQIKGVGIQQKGKRSQRFVHLDAVDQSSHLGGHLGSHLARPNIWSY